jgi:hypothetical protein
LRLKSYPSQGIHFYSDPEQLKFGLKHILENP